MLHFLKKIKSTQAGWGVTILRIVIGGIFFKAGTGKLFGWFGGLGPEGAASFFQSLGIPFPEFHAVFAGTFEMICGFALILGLFTRLAAIPLAIIMIVAIFTAHRDGDFYYPMVILTACLALIETGSGSLSLDRLMKRCEPCESGVSLGEQT